MNGRDKHGWLVRLNPVGSTEVIEWEIQNYWNPEQDGAEEAIGKTAIAEAYMAYGRTPMGVLSVERT